MDIVDFVMQQLMPVVDGLKAKDKSFAKEFEARKSELRDFADLFYKHCSKGGVLAACCISDDVEGQLVHFFHEPKGTVKSLDIDVKQFKNGSTPATSKTTSKTSGTKTTTTVKTASSKPTASVKTPAPAPVAPAPPVAPKAPAPAPPKASAPAPKPKIMDLF